MGLSLTDVCSLVTKGYKVDDLKKLGELLKGKDDKDASNIIELSKKLSFNELNSALSLLGAATGEADAATGSNDNQSSSSASDDKGKSTDTGKDNPDQNDSSGKDDIDYKALYEQEKTLRESLQKSARERDVSGAADQKTDEELMLEIATDILN